MTFKCKAPHNNMYFTVEGKVGPCWLQLSEDEQWSNSRSISDIWNGEKYNKIRTDLSNDEWNGPCKTCKYNIDNDVWPLAKAYEEYSVKEYPTMMELELSNQCNLECIMCSGILSSGIRKNRDKLPPLPQIYNDKFVEQLDEYIPHLEELRFNGGEPFAQKIVFDICLRVAEVRPDLKINIATNGTVYNKRVQELLDKCNIHLNISIDSLKKERYEEIRINGDFDKLMTNFYFFNQYCKDNNRDLSVMVNPMRNNWDEMIDFGLFAKEFDTHLWYNTIMYPEHLAIWNLPHNEIKGIYDTLSKQLNKAHVPKSTHHLVENQIKNWLLDSLLNA
jgi:radical SAM protein with 4Fe4S-binding SPASM domain